MDNVKKCEESVIKFNTKINLMENSIFYSKQLYFIGLKLNFNGQ